MHAPALALAVTLAASSPAPAHPPVAEATPLSFREFFDPSPRELTPSARLLELNGKRVKLVGFMAKMELPPRGAFYLTPEPIVCDESGGGTADLPPNAVYVLVRSLPDEEVPWAPRALEVTGVLEIGHRVEPDGRSTHVRLTLDRPEDLRRQAPITKKADAQVEKAKPSSPITHRGAVQ